MQPSDELLSAYLDGELTADEQARAERLLADDAQARRTFEELRGLRSSLQDLPRKGLPDDFAERVLQAARQQATSTSSESVPPKPAWHERIRRPLAYVALVLAASVLIVFFNPEHQRVDNADQPVALSTKPPEMAAPAEATLERAPPLDETLGKNIQTAPVEDALALAPATGSLLVVTCEISSNAAASDAFGQVLANNKISVNDDDPKQAQAAGLAGRPTLSRAARQEPNRPNAEAGLEVVYVEATPAQLESTLAEISAQPKEFLSIDVGAAEALGIQNRWQEQYSRGRGGLTQQRFVPTPAPSGPAPAKPTIPQQLEQTAPGQTAAGQSAPAAGQVAGRARGYAMPANEYQRSGGGLPSVQLDAAQRDKAGARVEQRREGSDSAESQTLRALFVLRVADEPAQAAKGDKQP
jgi:negative regulator of sigma E activity